MNQARPESPQPALYQLGPGHAVQGEGYFAWRPRGTGDWLLVQTLAGRGRFGFGSGGSNGEVLAEPGDVVLLKPGTPHDYGVEPELRQWELVWSHFRPRPGWLEWLNWPEEAPGLMRLRLADEAARARVAGRLLDVSRLAYGPAPRREALAMNALEEALLWLDAQNPLLERPALDPRVEAVAEYLRQHLHEPVRRRTLARLSGLSVSRLSHLFHEQTGTTPQEFHELLRFSRAKELLERTPRAVQDIAQELGFESPYYFSRRFRQRIGSSPRDYRKEVLAGLEAPRWDAPLEETPKEARGV